MAATVSRHSVRRADIMSGITIEVRLGAAWPARVWAARMLLNAAAAVLGAGIAVSIEVPLTESTPPQ